MRGRGGKGPPGRDSGGRHGASGQYPARRMGARVLVIDNYDSFVYNLVQYLGELGRRADRAPRTTRSPSTRSTSSTPTPC